MKRIPSLRLSTSLGDVSLRKVKDCYVACVTHVMDCISKKLINRSRGVAMIDMRMDEVQITMRIAIFGASRNHCFICYDLFEDA
jgi:hypothetical protein